MNKPTIEELNQYNMEKQLARCPFPLDKGFYLGKPGNEHYKLLAWFGYQYEGIQITEIGTLWGGSAMALGHNVKNKVITYDIVEAYGIAKFPYNIEKKIIDPDGAPFNIICQSDLIFYDAKHEGVEEQQFLDELIKRKWKGILILDDIHFNIPMADFWNGITLRKEDWTDIGHFCGTGIVYFD